MNILVNASRDPEVQGTFFPDWVREKLAEGGDCVRYGTFTREELKDALPGVDVLYSNWGLPVLDDDLLQKADRLKLVCYTGGTVADFMTEDTVRRGIRVLSGNRIYAASVAEGTIAYILAAQRRLKQHVRDTEETGWAPWHYSEGLRYHTVGILGFGMIARELLRMLPVFGCKVRVCSDFYTEKDAAEFGAEKVDLETLFAESDVVTLHESLTDETRHLVDARLLGQMKPGALFVNTARGAIVVEKDLAEAVRAGRIRAVCDVYETEPLPMDSPLRGLDDLLLIPHRAGPTLDLRPRVTEALIEDMNRFRADPTAELTHEISWAYAKHMTRHK